MLYIQPPSVLLVVISRKPFNTFREKGDRAVYGLDLG